MEIIQDGTVTLRRAPAARMTAVNPALAIDELGIEIDTGRMKIGPGNWNALQYVDNPNRLAVDAAFTSRFRPQLRDEVLDTHARHVTLISGSDDQAPTASGATLSTDTTNFTIGDRATLVTVASATTAIVTYDPVNPGRDDPMRFPPANAVGLSVHVPNASQVTSLSIEIYGDSGLNAGARWSRSAANAGGLVNGWNHLRWRASESLLNAWTAGCWRVRVVAATSAATTFTIGHAWLECRDKASIIFVNDGTYKTFYEQIYPDFQARRWPVTWAPDPADLGIRGIGTVNESMTEAQLAAAMASGNGDECSFHGWDGAATSAMTAAEYRADTLRAQGWLREHGYYSGAIWRAAVVQNLATNGAAANPYLYASATYTNQTGSGANAWPAVNRYNLIRFVLHNQPTATIDAALLNLRTTRGVGIWYTHGVEVGGTSNMDPTLWAYIRNAMDAAVAEGWLEVVTFSELLTRRGTRVIEAGGRTVVEWVDAFGVTQRQVLA
jgi:peptidoglycan/xylan/chitin deacetylase (PgdA/CDA1 family)